MTIVIKQEVSSFKEDLAFSLEASNDPFWDAFYSKAFPTAIRVEPVTDRFWQLQGADKTVYFANGYQLHVDEKIRRQDYDDILLEFVHEQDNGGPDKPGWIEKDLAMDYLAYAFRPSKRVYMLPWHLLRAAWLKYKDEWLEEYPRISGNNPTYTTWSCAVPIPVLLESVSIVTLFDLSDILP